MKSEQIARIGKLVYIKCFNHFGEVDNDSRFQTIVCKEGEYDCKKIFWRFYWVTDFDKFLN